MPALETTSLTVSQYATQLGRALREVGPATLEGEVQRPRRSSGGMLWFGITDGEATLSCKVFRAQARRLEHSPRDGDLVQIDVERPDLWAQGGKLDLIVGQVRLAGEGELLRRRHELLARLRAEGLCDPARRRPLPRFPRAVGVIAGRGSDAMSDVLRALSDRWPAVHAVACASLVQGKSAPGTLIDALACLQDHPRVDAIVLARGGGSVQDLACFDDERLCRAIFACAVPVVCAVGHTDNDPVCNHVSWPAYTPSRSAELVVPAAVEIRRELAVADGRLGAMRSRLVLAEERLESAGSRLDGARAVERRAAQLRERAGRLGDASATFEAVSRGVRERGERLRRGAHRELDDHAHDYRQALARLTRAAQRGSERRIDGARGLLARESELLGERVRRRLCAARREAMHLARFVVAHDFRRRGWLLAHGPAGPVRSSAELTVGGQIDLELHDGRARAAVVDVNIESENGSKTK
jgi:exodeoxyribonuclease VII large subunit